VAAKPRVDVTLAEYLALEARAEVKHELVAGTVLAMAGGTPAHSDLATNVTGLLFAALRGGGCRVNNSDLRVGRADADFRAYPDVVVTCGDRRTLDGEATTVENPTLVVEVTSDSTEAYDRGGKSAHYRRFPSLRGYVVVSHRSRSVDVLLRGEEGVWLLRTYGPGETIALESIGASLAVDAIYEGVTLDATPV
jgi:Uma2 family endonuclease